MKKTLIEFFATHRVSANLIMALMMISGLWAISQMNTQFLPNYNLNFIGISVGWSGASTQDISTAITIPIEEQMKDLDGLKKMTSNNREGLSRITLEFKSNTDMSEALEQAKQRAALVRGLPKDAEPIEIKRLHNYEEVARLIISGNASITELRPLIYQYKNQLMAAGISKVSISGLPDQEIAIQVPMQKLHELNLSLRKIATLIDQHSKDIPAGDIAKSESTQTLRSKDKKRSVEGFKNLPLLHDQHGQLLRLRDIATIEKRDIHGDTLAYYQGNPAVILSLYRTENANSLDSAKILDAWLKKTRATLPSSITITPYFESWKHISDRVNLLLRNAIFGLCFIIALLFLFLNLRIAIWVALGIPASFLAAIAVLYFYGGSINMISLFAVIMTLGIIVDDSIVVGEEVLSRLQNNSSLLDAVKGGTSVMLAPITASSLTTISAFIPLMLVGGIIGQILFDIPLVAICVIMASFIECFFVLPGHLYHNLKTKKFKPPLMQPYFNTFKEKYFRRFIQYTTKNSWVTLSTTLAIAIITIGVVFGGHTSFEFFPAPEGSTFQLNARFNAGTPPAVVKAFVFHLQAALAKTDKEISKKHKLLIGYAAYQNQTTPSVKKSSRKGERYASMFFELTSPDDREISNEKFLSKFKKNIKRPSSLENLTINALRAGPPGKDIDIEISGHNVKNIKAASITLSNMLKNIKGVSNINDELAYGKNQKIFKLTSQAHALNLTAENIGQQLRAAFTGKVAQIYHEPNEEIEVRVMLPDNERHQASTIDTLPILTKSGHSVPLDNIVTLKQERGYDELTHVNGVLTNRVSADINPELNNMNTVLNSLNDKVLAKLSKQYNVNFTFRGRKESQTDTIKDMLYGLMLALCLIYIILSWVFSSYGWPLIIITAIPLGIIGAIWGHILLSMPLTVISLFGLFGLSGIVINDSIILVNRYKSLKSTNSHYKDAIIEASCQRLRPVLLTSLTTIAGLFPLLLERSLQAQFLIPMAVSIVFGLIFSTVLILVLLPSMLTVYESLSHTINSKKST